LPAENQVSAISSAETDSSSAAYFGDFSLRIRFIFFKSSAIFVSVDPLYRQFNPTQ
jgi:hypothetical protein